MEGRTLTSHFQIETKQHELFNLDLGEGVPRRMLVFAVVAVIAWVALMVPILGAPNKFTFSFYAIPPVLLAYFGFQDSAQTPRRKALTQWAVKARYMAAGHKPVIRLGARQAHRTEYAPMGDRFPLEKAIRRRVPWLLPPEWETQTGSGAPKTAEAPAGQPITLRQSAQLVGFDRLLELTGEAKK